MKQISNQTLWLFSFSWKLELPLMLQMGGAEFPGVPCPGPAYGLSLREYRRKIQKRYLITVVETVMAANLVQILTTSLRNLSHLC